MMPVVTTRIDTGIYHNEWIGKVEIDEVLAAKTKLDQLADEDNLKSFMVLIGVEKATSFPLGLRELRLTIPNGIIEGVVYGVPHVGQLILRTFQPIAPVNFKLCRTRDEAIDYARIKLADR